MKSWKLLALLILIAIVVFVAWRFMQSATPPTTVPNQTSLYPQPATPKATVADQTSLYIKLIGSWFVHYSKEPYARLDVTFDDQTNSGIASAIADLSGPSHVYKEIELAHKPWETEWENEYGTECKFLPSTPEGGIWWVSRVKVTASDGSWSEYYADNPYGSFRHDYQAANGTSGQRLESNAWIGALYITETDSPHPLVYINTFPSEEAYKVDMTMRIYRVGDTQRWIATNDEPDAQNFFPRIAIPLIPGEQYYIHLNSRQSQPGPYSIVISNSSFQSGSTQTTPHQPDSYEIDDTPEQASPIALNEIQRRTIASDNGRSGDVDWLLFTFPKQ